MQNAERLARDLAGDITLQQRIDPRRERSGLRGLQQSQDVERVLVLQPPLLASSGTFGNLVGLRDQESDGASGTSFGSTRLFASTRTVPEAAPLRRTLRAPSLEAAPAAFDGLRTLPTQPTGRRP